MPRPTGDGRETASGAFRRGIRFSGGARPSRKTCRCLRRLAKANQGELGGNEAASPSVFCTIRIDLQEQKGGERSAFCKKKNGASASRIRTYGNAPFLFRARRLPVRLAPVRRHPAPNSDLAPSAGLEPTFQEPESCVLSITPRGHIQMTKFIIIDAWKKCNWICRKLFSFF